MEQQKVLAERIKALAKEKGLNYEKIATACNVPPRRIYRIMYGPGGVLNVFLFIKICKVLEVSFDEFFDTEEFRAIL